MTGARRVIPLPTPERVRSLVRFDGADFYWLPRPVSFFVSPGQWRAWTTKWSGKKIAIKQQNNGYHGIRIDRALIMLHRLIWVLHYGDWPKGEIDHINGDKYDNRIENMRDVDKSMNMRNQKVRSDSTSGFPGVFYSNYHKAWRAIIRTREARKHLGSFKTREAAIEARRAAQVEYGFTAHHGRAA